MKSAAFIKIILFILTAAVVLLGLTGVASAVSGLSYKFETPSLRVSPYYESSARYSVSLGAPQFPPLSPSLKVRPRIAETSYENQSFRFIRNYYSLGKKKESLIPASVSVRAYSSYRQQRKNSDNFYASLTSALTNPATGKRSSGLGLRVELPKRLQSIFGEGGAGLKVAGSRRIMFSGRSQWTDAAESPVNAQSKFPSLNMEQVSRFDITGTIGSKITVKVAQDSQTDIPLSNAIQIRYKGDDDDVLKSIEAGNTTLKLPNTRFVGYSSRIRGLFGLKAEAEVGNFRIIGIASQEKGSSEKTRITPTGEESAKIIRDNDYVERRIFDLGDATMFNPGDSIAELLVYQEARPTADGRVEGALWTKMFVDPRDTLIGGSTEKSDLTGPEDGAVLIEADEYDYFTRPDSNRHYIYFNSARRQYSIGVWMRIARADGTEDIIGDVDVGNVTPENPIILKLLYYRQPLSTQITWPLMWRNCYRIDRGSKIDDFEVKVFKGLRGSENSTTSLDIQEGEQGVMNYLEILGLDVEDINGNPVPDGRLDDRLSVFRPDWGLLILPHRRPFDTDTTFNTSVGRTHQLEVRLPKLYDYVVGSTDKTDASQYFFKIFTKTRSSVIRLGRPNIIEGSEKITVNGRTLQRGTGYTIQYDFGTVTLLDDEATDQNANINIDFEYAPFLAIQKKTLLGLRGEYSIGKNFDIGTTILYKSDKAEERKPRVGYETSRMIVYDVDASWKFRPSFLTKAVNALPFISTETPSSVSMSTEVAQSHPNPNVEGIAYVDDFEASAEHLNLGLSRTQWRKASRPVQLDSREINGDYSWERSKLLWHNPIIPLQFDQVYNTQAVNGVETQNSLRLVFRPNSLDTAWSETVVDSDTVLAIDSVYQPEIPRNSWAGFTRYFSGRIDAERAQLFEIRARADSGLIMHIEFGLISEDVDGNNNAFAEDRAPVGVFEVEEDVGIDGLPDSLEPGYDALLNPDPNGDNWFFIDSGICPIPGGRCDTLDWANDSVYFEWLNGTEGNHSDYEWLFISDEEAFSTGMNSANGYFTYRIDFGDPNSPFRLDSTLFYSVDDVGKPPWYTYRIPIRNELLRDALDADSGIVVDDPNDPNLIPEWQGNKIRHIRVWFESRPDRMVQDTVEIADWYFVQTNWRDTIIYADGSDSSSVFTVASISEDDGSFEAPPNVEAYSDPNTNILEAQKGLLLLFEQLDHRDTPMATKKLLSVDRYSGYRRMEMYVNYEPANPDDSVLFFFRLGTDSLNYYEQRRHLNGSVRWHSGNRVNLDFNEITALKDEAQRKVPRGEWRDVDVFSPDSVLHIVGNPNLNEIKFFAAGVINLDTVRPVSGQVWIDELRVTDVRRDIGSAGRLSLNGNLADLGSYNFSYQSQDPFFRGLSTSTRGGSADNLGSGQTQTTSSYGFSLNLDRFMPRAWGARFPITYSASKSTMIPLLRTASDVILPEDVRVQEQSVSSSQNVSISPSFKHQGGNILFSALLNRIKNTRISYRRSEQTSVNIPYTFGESYSLKSGFDFNFKQFPGIPLFFWTKWLPLAKNAAESRLQLYPNRWTISGSFDRNLTLSDALDGTRRSSLTKTLDGTMDVNFTWFKNLSSSVRMTTRRDLSDTGTVRFSLSDPKLGLELNYSQTFSSSYKPKILPFLTSDLAYKAGYTENWDRQTDSRRSSMNSSWSVKGTFDHKRLFGGKSSARNRRAPKRGGRRAGQKTTEQKESRPFYDPPLAVLRFLTGWIDAPKYGYSQSYKNVTPGITARPSLQYTIGLTRTTDVPTVEQSVNPSASETESYDLTSGFSILGGINTGVKFRRSIGRDLVKQGTRRETRSTNWPDLQIQIKQFTKLPLIKGSVNKFIKIFSPRTGFSRSTKESFDLDKGFLIQKSVSTNISPLLSINFKLFKKLSLSSSYGITKDFKQSFNNVSGEQLSSSSNLRKTFNTTTKYSFSMPGGFKLPLFGRVKFKSTMSMTLDIKKSSSLSENYDAVGTVTSSSEKSELSITPDISYAFSKQIRGGLRMRWTDSVSRNRSNHLREVQIWIQIQF